MPTKPPKTKRVPKTEVILLIQTNTGYGYGWEDASAYPSTPEGRKQARADLKEYNASNTGAHRIISRRVDRVTQEPVRRGAAKPNARRPHDLSRHVTKAPRGRAAPAAATRQLFVYGAPEASSRLALAEGRPLRVVVSWPGSELGAAGTPTSSQMSAWASRRFVVPDGFRRVAVSPWRLGNGEGVLAVLLAPSSSTAIDIEHVVEVRGELTPKPNGARRLKRTMRACAARGRALKRTGSPVAASRLARYCPPLGRRKKNGAEEGEFEEVELDGNMSPATLRKLDTLLRERLRETFRVEDHENGEMGRVLFRRKMPVYENGTHGRYVWQIPKARLLSLIPSLLRSRRDDEVNLGRAIVDRLNIDVA